MFYSYPITKKTRVEDIYLFSHRIKKCLKKDGIEILEDILARDADDFLHIPNFGQKSLQQLMFALREIENRKKVSPIPATRIQKRFKESDIENLEDIFVIEV